MRKAVVGQDEGHLEAVTVTRQPLPAGIVVRSTEAMAFRGRDDGPAEFRLECLNAVAGLDDEEACIVFYFAAELVAAFHEQLLESWVDR